MFVILYCNFYTPYKLNCVPASLGGEYCLDVFVFFCPLFLNFAKQIPIHRHIRRCGIINQIIRFLNTYFLLKFQLIDVLCMKKFIILVHFSSLAAIFNFSIRTSSLFIRGDRLSRRGTQGRPTNTFLICTMSLANLMHIWKLVHNINVK